LRRRRLTELKKKIRGRVSFGKIGRREAAFDRLFVLRGQYIPGQAAPHAPIFCCNTCFHFVGSHTDISDGPRFDQA
jgi:hypothetical protein